MRANEPLTALKGIGDALAQKFHVLNIRTVGDLIENVPRRYEDYSKVIRVSQIRPGTVTIKVTFSAVKSRYSKRGLHMTEAMATDDSGSVKVVWFNQPYRAQSLKQDEEYYVSGEFASNYKFFAITNPACELVSSFPIHTARLVPVYRLTKGLGMAQMRRAVKQALLAYKPAETMPAWLIDQEQLLGKAEALQQMHFPTDSRQLEQAKKRIGFEEVLELTLASELNKQEFKTEHSQQIPFDEQAVKKFVASLPYTLTDDQRKAAWEIYQDMEQGRPMNRLVEGDVGSGKTVVAAMASIVVFQAGLQVALMAPTELLAKQHAESLRKLLSGIGKAESVLLLTGSMSAKQKHTANQAMKNGTAQLIVGTHALIQESAQFHNLGLVIVDEQHRFGVNQRKLLQAKAAKMPHVLNLTATPIPRSLALTLYSEMDVSIIAQLPPGRKKITTKIEIPENRPKLYALVAEELDAGRQAFVVCPQIEETELSRLAVKRVFKEISQQWLKGYKVGLLHGKMKSDEKDSIMQAFVDGELHVLVSTTVIEVGVDVPNANIMVIEGADKFGLAQLHQLRGRVGRGEHASYCYAVLSSNDEPTKRLRVLERESNGFKLAEYDLELRGPGAIYGTMQHGALDLRVANITDTALIKTARQAAKQFVERGENLLQYPQLAARVNTLRTINNLN